MRKDGFHHTGEAIIYRSYGGFKGFPYPRVPSAYRNSCPGYSVALVLRPSKADKDFGVPILFLSADELEVIQRALDKSDELTHQLLGRGWGGKRPYWKLEDFM